MALDFFAGCVGGCAGVLVGHPFDTTKVYLQTQNSSNLQYRGTFHCLRKIIAKESFRGLYKGVTSPVGGVSFINAIIFGVYGNTQRLSSNPDSLKTHFVAGSAAGIAQSIICSPMELVRTRMQLQHQLNKTYRNPLECFKHIWKVGKFKGVFNGLGITALRDWPGFAIYFVSYEVMVTKESSPFRIFMAGGSAGVISWIFLYPVDVIKTKMQMDTTGKYLGIFDCTKKTYKSEGLPVFTRGISSSLYRAFPTSAACFLVVEMIFRINDKLTGTNTKIIEFPVALQAQQLKNFVEQEM